MKPRAYLILKTWHLLTHLEVSLESAASAKMSFFSFFLRDVVLFVQLIYFYRKPQVTNI